MDGGRYDADGVRGHLNDLQIIFQQERNDEAFTVLHRGESGKREIFRSQNFTLEILPSPSGGEIFASILATPQGIQPGSFFRLGFFPERHLVGVLRPPERFQDWT